ncbi:MAG: RCC1 repeat-containing protein, partial [Actinomycetota bacterium]
ISSGLDHTCALTSGGGVKCGGYNFYGQVGDGTYSDRGTPVDVTGLSSGVAAISAGTFHNCALTTGGGVTCWGNNGYGELGDGKVAANSSTPVAVTGLSSGVAAISAGLSHTCALTNAGGAKCWGRNQSGELGDGTTTERDTPVDVTGLTSGVAAISTGGEHTCALTTGGGVKCWGNNSNGQVGDGTTTERDTPVAVTGLTSGVTAISASRSHTCALTTGGGVNCWGGNSSGQLGDGTTTERDTPVAVTGLTSGVVAISAGGAHTCALTSDGGAKCWGSNDSGQLGDGTTSWHPTPSNVIGLLGGYEPDGQIAKAKSGPYAGNDIYNTTGLNQTKSAKIAPGTTVSFYIQVQNDGNSSDSFTLKGPGSDSGFVVHYSKGTTDITTGVVAGTYSTTTVATDATVSFRITVKAGSSVTTGSKKTVRLLATSSGDSTKQDAVKAVVSVG